MDTTQPTVSSVAPASVSSAPPQPAQSSLVPTSPIILTSSPASPAVQQSNSPSYEQGQESVDSSDSEIQIATEKDDAYQEGEGVDDYGVVLHLVQRAMAMAKKNEEAFLELQSIYDARYQTLKTHVDSLDTGLVRFREEFELLIGTVASRAQVQVAVDGHARLDASVAALQADIRVLQGLSTQQDQRLTDQNNSLTKLSQRIDGITASAVSPSPAASAISISSGPSSPLQPSQLVGMVTSSVTPASVNAIVVPSSTPALVSSSVGPTVGHQPIVIITGVTNLPRFSGERDDDWATWIQRIQVDSQFSSMPDANKKSTLRSLLDGSASSIALAQPSIEYDQMTYEQWKVWLGSQVIPRNQRQRALSKISTMEQLQNETVNGWCGRLRQTFHQANLPDDDNNETFAYHLWRGLRLEFQQGMSSTLSASAIVKKARSREESLLGSRQSGSSSLPSVNSLNNYVTTDQLINLVSALQQRHSPSSPPQSTATPTPSPSQPVVNMEKRGGFTKIRRDRISPNGEIICNYCDQPGHMKPTCSIRTDDQTHGEWRLTVAQAPMTFDQFTLRHPRTAARIMASRPNATFTSLPTVTPSVGLQPAQPPSN